MKTLKLSVKRLIIALVIVTSLMAISACSKTSSTATTTTTTTSQAAGVPVSVDLVAQNMAFDKKTITVPAGANVTINFNNKDSLPHNFAVYTNSSASTTIFQGQVVTGPNTITYIFTAPATPGTYFFRCDIHPTSLNGNFIVQ